MTPLGVSLTFIVISILISLVKHFVFPSSTASTTEETSIDIKKLYTITDKRSQKQAKSYSSFYEAYHQFHSSQAEEQKHRIQQNFMKHYNSVALKKTIINDEHTIICQENFLLTISQGVNCLNTLKSTQKDTKQCSWTTYIDVYELPLLKQETKQSIVVQGRMGLASKDLKGENLKQNLKCNKIQNTKTYFMTFPLSSKITQQTLETWTLNKLTIVKKTIGDQNDKKNRKNSKADSKKQELNQSFQVQVQSFDLEKPHHQPIISGNYENAISYIIESEPWIVRYKISDEWRQINILEKGIQKRIYEDLEYSSRVPPFDRNDRIEVKNMFVYGTKEDIYPVNCNRKEENSHCGDRIRHKRNTYLTLVYLHINNQFRVQKFYVQLTFEIDRQDDTENQHKQSQNQRNQTYNKSQEVHPQNFVSGHQLISYSLLVSEINPSRQIHSSCAINPKKQEISDKVFDKHYWLYERKLISSLQTYSLFCVFRFEVDEHLKVVEISDLIHSTQINRYNDFAFLDWKSLNKILNYKQNFEEQTKLKNYQNAKNIPNPQNTSKKHVTETRLKKLEESDQENLEQTKSAKAKRSENPEDNLEEYQKIFNQEFVSTKKSQQNKTLSKDSLNKKKNKRKKGSSQNDGNKKTEKIDKKKRKNKTDSQKEKDKAKNKHSAKEKLALELENSYNYSLIKKVVFPHRSEVKKYKFPLPFLLTFTQRMQIVDSNPLIPMILFSGVKQYLFTYNYKSQTPTDQANTSLPHKIVDYRYLTLGSTYKPTSKLFHPSEGSPQNQIQTVRIILRNIQSKSVEKQNEKLTIEIKDETHPEVQNVIKTMYESDEEILNQIKSIKSVPVQIKRRWSEASQDYELPETYQRYLIVVWGWGVEVYLVDWDKNGFLRDNVTQQEIQELLSKKSSNLIEYFLPFIELFATFYCMFQALISSR